MPHLDTVGAAVLLSVRGAKGGAIGVVFGQITLWGIMTWSARGCDVRQRLFVYMASTIVALTLPVFCDRFFVQVWLACGTGLAIVAGIAFAIWRVRRSVGTLPAARGGMLD